MLRGCKLTCWGYLIDFRCVVVLCMVFMVLDYDLLEVIVVGYVCGRVCCFVLVVLLPCGCCRF